MVPTKTHEQIADIFKKGLNKASLKIFEKRSTWSTIEGSLH